MNPQAIRTLAASARDPRALLRLARGNVELWANLIVISWAVAFMLWQGVGFATTIATVFAIWAILAVSLNLVVGFTGLLSVGHIGFFGIGAYSMAILTSDTSYEQLRTGAIPTLGWPFFAALPVSIALAGLLALVVGVAFNRFRGRHLRPRLVRVRDHRLQLLPQPARPHPRRLRDSPDRAARDRRMGARWRL